MRDGKEVFMYKKILVPLDGSERAETILAHVEALARCCDSEVIFLEVVVPEVVFTPTHGMIRDIRLEEQKLAEHVDRAKAYLSGLEEEFKKKHIQARSLVEVGSVVQMIIDRAEEEGADLIAMASHGRAGLSHVFYGSVAAGVLHRVDRPLLLVRAEEEQPIEG
jgi:nucleotide-binding universal stress UspA family protein